MAEQHEIIVILTKNAEAKYCLFRLIFSQVGEELSYSFYFVEYAA